jgi:AraC-like DNA-binding protein
MLDAGSILFVGPGGPAERHAHHAVQFAWAVDGELTVTLDAPLRRRAVLIPANVPHKMDSSGRRVAFLLIEPRGARGLALDRRARAALGVELADDLETLAFPRLDTSVAEAVRWRDAALSALGADQPAPPLSMISKRAIAYIESVIDGKPQLAEAARHAGVSPTRLTHVFTREVGIPFRRFVLWTRMKQVAASTQAGHDLTRAAADAGFSDSAHLSRTFRRMFGISPSMFMPYVELVGDLRPR